MSLAYNTAKIAKIESGDNLIPSRTLEALPLTLSQQASRAASTHLKTGACRRLLHQT
jgi:hypothetical protein